MEAMPIVLIGGGIFVLGLLAVMALFLLRLLSTPAERDPVDQHELQQRRDERKARFQKLLTDLPTSTRDEIIDLIGQRQKIAAIKLLRDATGMGLREAKEAVELLE